MASETTTTTTTLFAHLDVLQWLIDGYPDSLAVRDRHGNVPLHNAVQQRGPDATGPGVLPYLVQAHPAALDARNRCGHLPLHAAIVSNNYAAATLLLRAHRSNGTPLHALELPDEEPLLHFALSHGQETTTTTKTTTTAATGEQSQSFVAFCQAVIEKFPEAVRTVDHRGNLPLHTACQCHASPSVVDLLIAASCSSSSNHHHHHNGLATFNNDGWLPFHVACYYSKDGILMDHLVKKLTWGVAAANLPRTKGGIHPLELARGNKDDNGTVIYTLLRHHPHHHVDAVQQLLLQDHGRSVLPKAKPSRRGVTSAFAAAAAAAAQTMRSRILRHSLLVAAAAAAAVAGAALVSLG